jgi:hypoxia up-regulated 1
MIAVLLFTCSALVSSAQAAVLAVDLGSEFLKVSIVKPGRTPISIVLNEM